MIDVTDKALEELKKVLSKKDATSRDVRIYIAGFGWGGPSFGLALDEQKDNDEVKVLDDIKVVVDQDLIAQFGGFNVDYSNDWIRKGFQITTSAGGSSSCG